MKYKIGGTTLQSLNIELNEKESIYSESGGMAWMSDNVVMDTKVRGGVVKGITRKIAGESFFMTTFTCQKGKGVITFTSEFPGKIIPIKFEKGKELICQKDAFMCAQLGVNLSLYLKKRLGAGFFGGEGFILQKISGKGLAWFEIAGEVIQYDLKKDQALRVDTGHIAMYEPSVDYSVERVRGVRNILFAGEGLFLATLKGPGKVWLQTMPMSVLAGKIAQYMAARGMLR
jgi:uncharacterized protein (TIGR00266 family)